MSAACQEGDNPWVPNDERPLRKVFLDLNSFFASVEQQEDKKLRDRPIAVVPVMADTSCAIAASYHAKKFGIRTGTKIGEAKKLCPDLILILANPQLYVHYHHRVLEAVETVLPVEKVCSIDEMQFHLLGKEQVPEQALRIGKALKQVIYDRVGSVLGCSIGIAPNGFLAKIGTEIQKPDGLIMLQKHDYKDQLKGLKLLDLPGINRRMLIRLYTKGIYTVDDLLNASRKYLRHAFGSVIGERWWFWLRGYEFEVPGKSRSSLGHSHVLPPQLRTEDGAKEVLIRLLQKASVRLHNEDLWTQSMVVYVRGIQKSWKARAHFNHTQDVVRLTDCLLDLWKERDFVQPLMVGVTLYELTESQCITPSLFDPHIDRLKLNTTIDNLNRKFGKNTIYLAGMIHAKETAEEKIAFGKTNLLDEGNLGELL